MDKNIEDNPFATRPRKTTPVDIVAGIFEGSLAVVFVGMFAIAIIGFPLFVIALLFGLL